MTDIITATNDELDQLALMQDALAEAQLKKTEEKESAATMLVKIAEELFEFDFSETGETFGIPKSGPRVVFMLRGGKVSLRKQLSLEYFKRTKKAASAQAVTDALLVIEGMAQQQKPKKLHLRVARHDGAIWVDLGDPTGRAIRVDVDGWTVEDEAPVLFKRTELTGILPAPLNGGCLDKLWRWLNVAEEDRALVAAWLVAVLFPDIPHPILNISGEQGSGKSTAAKALVRTLDPSPVPTRKSPREEDGWISSAAGSWVVGLDNLSNIPDWLSDALCRAVTGDGDVRRRLYTDGDLHVYAFRRCPILNGIDIGAVRGDLADRLLSIGLDVISEEKRIPETELWPRFDEDHPYILGAILDLAAGVLETLPSVDLAKKPRMADFALILAAADVVTGDRGLERYFAKQGELAADSLTDDGFVQSLEKLGNFEGTSSRLLSLVATPEKPPKGWPANGRSVTQLLHRQAPVMRKAGWHIENDGAKNHAKVLIWTIRPPAKPEYGCNSSPPSPPSTPNPPEKLQDRGGGGDKIRPHLNGHTCHHCGLNGEVLECSTEGETLHLHRNCIDLWTAAQDSTPG